MLRKQGVAMRHGSLSPIIALSNEHHFMFNPFAALFDLFSPPKLPAHLHWLCIGGATYMLSASSPTGVSLMERGDCEFHPCLDGHVASNGVPIVQITIALAIVNNMIRIDSRSFIGLN